MRKVPSKKSPKKTPPKPKEEDFDFKDAMESIPHSEQAERWKSISHVAKSFSLWRPAPAVLTQVRSVKTIFPMVDRATRVGGYPIDRVNTCHGPSNHGKAQPIDEPVLTPQGWKPIGQLVVGDEVIGSEGTPVKVIGVYPQGKRPVFRIELYDGSSTRACSEHLWLSRIGVLYPMVRTTKELLDIHECNQGVVRIPTLDQGWDNFVTNFRHAGVVECVCIKVDAPDHLYVTKDFILTHNTAFSLGLGLSFLLQGHVFAHIDAEMTTPASWISKLFGREVNNPGFVAMRPRNYEQAIDGVKELTDSLADARANGHIPDDTTALIVVDSIRKLVPKSLLKKIEKEGADGLGGRAQQLKAMMNQAWLDDLTPQLYHTGSSVLLIARESERPNATDSDRKYDQAWQVQGGKGIIYDASLVMRITRSAWVYAASEAQKKPVVGEKIKVSIWKTKVESKDDKHAIGYFHLSNGTQTPEGFDRARDVLELATSYGIISQAGSWYSYGGKKLGNGKDAVVQALHGNPQLMHDIEEDCRDEFKPEDVIPMGHDDHEVPE